MTHCGPDINCCLERITLTTILPMRPEQGEKDNAHVLWIGIGGRILRSTCTRYIDSVRKKKTRIVKIK